MNSLGDGGLMVPNNEQEIKNIFSKDTIGLQISEQ